MALIRDLQMDKHGFFANGKFDSYSLFQGEIKISIFVDAGATEADAEKCIEHYNSLLEKPEVLEQIHSGVTNFFLYMYDEWGAFDAVYGEIYEALKPVMDDYKAGNQVITHLSKPCLIVYPQLENEIGYGLECECPWEPEHMCMILIRNDKVVYVGPSNGEDPWGDESDYYCIWED